MDVCVRIYGLVVINAGKTAKSSPSSSDVLDGFHCEQWSSYIATHVTFTYSQSSFGFLYHLLRLFSSHYTHVSSCIQAATVHREIDSTITIFFYSDPIPYLNMNHPYRLCNVQYFGWCAISLLSICRFAPRTCFRRWNEYGQSQNTQ